MKVYKPYFFDKFYCIADKCDFTCCRDWSIGVDEDTLDRWEEMDIPCRCNLPKGTLSDYVEDDALILNDNQRCHFLNEQGLCNIVLEYGEEALSNTCHTFPKVIYDYDSRSEYTLNLGCKFAVEKLLDEETFKVVAFEEKSSDSDDLYELPECIFKLRDYMLKNTYDTSISNIKLLKAFIYMLNDIKDKLDDEELEDIIEDYISKDGLKDIINVVNKESVDEVIMYNAFIEHNELLTDMLQDYIYENMYIEFINDIYSTAKYLITDNDEDNILIADRFFNEFRTMFSEEISRVIQNEIYGFIIPSEEDDEDCIEGMIKKLQWLIMEIVALEQWLFILLEINREVSKEDFVTAVAVLFRITGFSDEDIYDYLDDEFDDEIWNKEYINLICN